MSYIQYLKGKGTGKVHPVQAIKAYRGSGNTAPLIPNCANRRQVHVQLHAPVALPPVHIQQEAGCIPGPVLTFWRREKSPIHNGNRTTIPHLYNE